MNMNDEYKHIAVEATKWCEEHAQGTPVAWEWEKKYAELIIKQCTDICTMCQDDVAYDEIKEYFGVTE